MKRPHCFIVSSKNQTKTNPKPQQCSAVDGRPYLLPYLAFCSPQSFSLSCLSYLHPEMLLQGLPGLVQPVLSPVVSVTKLDLSPWTSPTHHHYRLHWVVGRISGWVNHLHSQDIPYRRGMPRGCYWRGGFTTAHLFHKFYHFPLHRSVMHAASNAPGAARNQGTLVPIQAQLFCTLVGD